MSNGANRHIDQDRWGLIPIIRTAYYLRWEVLEFLLERNESSRVEKIEASQLVKQGRFAEVLSILWSVLETIRDYFYAKKRIFWSRR